MGTSKAKALCRFSRQQRLKPWIDHDLPPGTRSRSTAGKQGIDLTYSCSAGAWSTGAGPGLAGKVDQFDQSYVDVGQIAQGFALLCVSHPLADCTFRANAEVDIS